MNKVMTIEEFVKAKASSKPKKNKYGVAPKEQRFYNGNLYDSKAEMKMAIKLDFEKERGNVERWERQVKYDLVIDGKKVCSYVLDFKVYYKDGTIKHFDVKGYRKGIPYELFKLKKKLMDALHKIEIEEVY